MSKPTLFICQSCRADHAESSDRPADGARLLEHLQDLHQTWARQSELEIQPVECLWTCDHPCAIALSSSEKSTYLIAKITVTENSAKEMAEAILGWSERYLDSKDGTVVWKQFPEALQTNIVARIPSLTASSNES